MREMSEKLLSIRNLHASVEGQSILNGIDLDINPGEVHVLMGPNGAGKSTLANVILGDPRYEVTEGSIFFEGADITEEKRTPAPGAASYFPSRRLRRSAASRWKASCARPRTRRWASRRS